MEKQKKEPLATEIIGDLQNVVSTTLSEIEALTLDLDMAEFILNELLELTDKNRKMNWKPLDSLRTSTGFISMRTLPVIMSAGFPVTYMI